VKAGDKLFEVADFSIMWFVFKVYEQDIPWIKLGQVVEVTTPSVPGSTFKGKISFVDPNMDPDTRTTQVRVELPNSIVDGRRVLLHRVYADGMVFHESSDVLTVPRSALLRTGHDDLVYIEQNAGIYERRAVKVGRLGDKLAEILSGLKAGEKVVTNGNLLIDAQAEMDRGFAASPQSSTTDKPLAEPQRSTLGDFVAGLDALAADLASDNLDGFNQHYEAVILKAQALQKAFADEPKMATALSELNTTRGLHNASNLKEARAMFYPVSVASAALLEPLRKTGLFTSFEVFECSMVNRAVDNASEKGRWIQSLSSTIRNPFYGKEMLECGTRIQP
jgi:Cu(I)/Ag(I) efflux system membrane fusion protein